MISTGCDSSSTYAYNPENGEVSNWRRYCCIEVYDNEEVDEEGIKRRYDCDLIYITRVPRPILSRYEILDI